MFNRAPRKRRPLSDDEIGFLVIAAAIFGLCLTLILMG